MIRAGACRRATAGRLPVRAEPLVCVVGIPARLALVVHARRAFAHCSRSRPGAGTLVCPRFCTAGACDSGKCRCCFPLTTAPSRPWLGLAALASCFLLPAASAHVHGCSRRPVSLLPLAVDRPLRMLGGASRRPAHPRPRLACDVNTLSGSWCTLLAGPSTRAAAQRPEPGRAQGAQWCLGFARHCL